MKSILIIIIVSFLSQAYSADLSKQFGIGGSIGYPVPVFGNTFNDLAEPEWSASLYGRYHFDPFTGIDLSFSKEEFVDTSIGFKNVNLLGFYRVFGASDITPIFGLGAGITSIKNYSPRSGKLAFLGRAGIEYSVIPLLTLGALVDYKYVSKIMGEMPTGPAHIIIPQLAVTFYFGENKNQEEVKQPEKEKTVSTEIDEVKVTNASTDKMNSGPDLTIEFDTDKSDIKPNYIGEIKKLSERLKESNDHVGLIEGHADSTGPKAYNNKLSLRRANNLKKMLIEFGVDQKRLTVEGFGEDRPIADNNTVEGRQKNRRSTATLSIVRSHLNERM